MQYWASKIKTRIESSLLNYCTMVVGKKQTKNESGAEKNHYAEKHPNNSLKAVSEAMIQTRSAPNFTSAKQAESGRKNSKSPVSLLPKECGICNLWAFRLSIRMPVAFDTAMSPVQIQTQSGMDRHGRIFTA